MKNRGVRWARTCGRLELDVVGSISSFLLELLTS